MPTNKERANPTVDRWRVVQLNDGKRLLDPRNWQDRWRGETYKVSSELELILARLKKLGVDSQYIEWLLRPDYLKGSHKGHAPSRLPEPEQKKIVELFDCLDALLTKMRAMVNDQLLPGRPVEVFRRWLISFEANVEPACPLIAGHPAVMRKFRKAKPNFFRGHPSEERVLIGFLLAEELRVHFPNRYWPLVADIIAVRFPTDVIWCTPAKLSRAVGRLQSRVGAKAAHGIAESYRHWFKHISRK
jgi:hypothetical protein